MSENIRNTAEWDRPEGNAELAARDAARAALAKAQKPEGV